MRADQIMTERPLVSVLTGTYPPRLDAMLETMHHLREQSYPAIEHCIGVEGEPDEVDAVVARLEQEAERLGSAIPTRIVGLGRWWSRYLTNSISTVPFQSAQWMSRGEYLMWLSDDERMLVPDHVEQLVHLLESGLYDFVYPLVETYRAERPDRRWIVGTDPPVNGSITHCLYRARLLDIGGFRPHVGSGSDWDQVEQWMAAGATWACLPRVTFSHASNLGKVEMGTANAGAR